MSKSSRRRWHARQAQLAKERNLQKAQLPPVEKSGTRVPLMSQVTTVERNPFVPASVEPRADARVKAHATLTQEYVPSGLTGYYPFLRALPPYIDDITQQFGMQVYSQMLTDPVVYASARVFTLAIIANGWELVPALTREEHDYDVAVKMRDLIQKNLDELETPYDIVLEQHLNAFSYGVNVSEQVYKLLNHGSGLLGIKDLRDKPLNNTIIVVDSFNNTVGILTQRFPGQNFPAGSYIPIDFSAIATPEKGHEFDLSDIVPGFLPRSLFSVLTNEMRYNDERGHSGLRSAYSPWWFKQQAIAEYLAWLSKFATPSLVGTTAPNAQPQVMLNSDLTPVLDASGNPVMKTPETVLSEALAEFQNGSAIAVPNGSTVEAISVGTDGEAFAKAMNWCNSEIVRGTTYQFLATSEGMHQARAASDTHQDILSLGILRRKQWLANQQRREVYKRLLMYNFDMTGDRIARYVPKLNLGLGDGFPMTPESIAKLMQSKYFGEVPDPAQMEKLDDRLGLPRRERILQQHPIQINEQATQKPNQPESTDEDEEADDGELDNAMKSLIQKKSKSQIVVAQPINLTLPKMKAAPREQPNIVVNVPPQPAPKVTVNVPAPQVNVSIPAPKVNVNVPVPKVTVNPPRVTVNVPSQDDRGEQEMTVERDRDGLIKRIIKRR